MAKLPFCRVLFETEPQTGLWNMAVDDVLLDTAVTAGLATFRWYRWIEPTLSLGYFQQAADVAADPRWTAVPIVRRLTGGGAILHHHEWTYSLAVPARQSLFRHPEELYELVHSAIIELFRRRGFEIQERGETSRQSPEPLLCFSRRDAHDVVRCGQKILGSAQRRRKGAVLQHGSLLLEQSPLSPGHFGLRELGFCGDLGLAELAFVPEQLADQAVAGALSSEETSAARAKLLHAEQDRR